MMLAYLAAGAAAICYGFASVLQAVGVRRAQRGETLRLPVRLAAQWPYVAGLALDLVGFVLSALALRSLPLFLVQSLVAANVGVTAFAAMLLLKARLQPLEVLALVCVGSGLALLALGARPGHANPLPYKAQWLLLATLPAVVGSAAAAARTTVRAAPIALAAAAGAGFSAVGIAARGLAVPSPWWQVFTAPGLWAIAGFGVFGVIAFSAALQRGSVTVVAAVMAGIETVVPSAVGLAVLGDATRRGFGPAATATGFALTIAGVFLLGPYSDLEGASTTAAAT